MAEKEIQPVTDRFASGYLNYQIGALCFQPCRNAKLLKGYIILYQENAPTRETDKLKHYANRFYRITQSRKNNFG